jgi:tRNA threonylcarbamoyl adenosine modification protein YeaZ
MLLAIDTSAGTSVAVVDRDAGVLAERSSPDTRRHAELIGTFIADCLTESGIAVAALSGVVAGMGPGPYTGLRVGIAAARAFALGAGKRVVPVMSHDAIAFEAYANAASGPLLVATDARRREVAWSVYSGADAAGLPQRTDGPHLAPAAELSAFVPHFDTYRLIEAGTVSAAALGMLAETMYVNRRPFAPDEAIYLRAPDVTMSAGPKRVTS